MICMPLRVIVWCIAVGHSKEIRSQYDVDRICFPKQYDAAGIFEAVLSLPSVALHFLFVGVLQPETFESDLQ